MSSKEKSVNKKAKITKASLPLKFPPLSDPRITMLPKISEKFRSAVTSQSDSIAVLLKSEPSINSQTEIAQLIKGMNELIDLVPEIEAAVQFALDSGWNYGAKRGVSEQNTKNINKAHEKSRLAKEKFNKFWNTKKWKTKKACVHDNYETVMKECGLWNGKENEQKPSVESFVRDMYQK
jgi:hypothetical protein